MALMGLIDVLSIPSILKVLVFTKQSGTPCDAFRRYAMTILHTHYIYTSDISDPKSKFFKSLSTIRWKHCRASKLCKDSNFDEIKNRDLALTQFGFFGYGILKSKEFGLSDDSNAHEALIHFWRVIGHLIGIPDRLNICRKNATETIELGRKIMNEVMTTNVKENHSYFREMTIIMLSGVSCINVLLDNEAILYFFYKLHNLEYDKKLSLYSWLNLKYHNIVFITFNLPIIGVFVKSIYNIVMLIIFWILNRYPLIAWYRFGKIKSRFQLHPHIQLH
ncbi:uncharacterized protein LOC127276667 isoform X2 [Leptopilina boulardi]|nr:uncharacterized protein LOC127276667 isoform X2 [Leptopilina boulardi]